MKHLLFAAAAIIAFASCNVNYEKTPSGLSYKIFPGKEDSPKLKPGQFVKMNIIYSIHLPQSNKDSILNSTYNGMPGYSPIDTSARAKYTIMEVFPQCHVGDSVECLISIDTLKNRGEIPDYNKTFARGGVIHCNARILASYNTQQDVMADYQNSIKVITVAETKDLQAYADKKRLKTQSSKNGVLVSIETPGDPANMADSGKQVSIMYKGYLETTGVVFDTNMDSSKGHTKPIDVVLGEHRVIPGWEEGLKFFGKGGKGTMLIPAMLAYGQQGSPPVIPAYSNLVFDIQVLDVTVAPAPKPGAPMGGHLTPAQMEQLQKQMKRSQDSAHTKD